MLSLIQYALFDKVTINKCKLVYIVFEWFLYNNHYNNNKKLAIIYNFRLATF